MKLISYSLYGAAQPFYGTISIDYRFRKIAERIAQKCVQQNYKRFNVDGNELNIKSLHNRPTIPKLKVLSEKLNKTFNQNSHEFTMSH